MATLELRNIRKTYGTSTEVVKGINLSIADREFVVFVGPSGCGKSTLLRMIAGLESITSGELYIDGALSNDIPADKRELAMVFQSYALYPHMSVAENMGFSLKMAKRPKAEIEEKVQEAARILQLEALLKRRPRMLSGGQRQRVAIGRAIVRHPKCFLFDEPLSNLDAALRMQMRAEIAKLHHDLESTMIYVTHDQVEAMTMADRIVVLNGGHIEQVGTPMELYHTPATRFVAEFIGAPRMNMISTKVTSASGTSVSLALPGGATVDVASPSAKLTPGEELTLGLRPETLDLDANGLLHGKIDVVEHLGSETLVYVEVPGTEGIIVKAAPDQPAKPGERVGITPRLERACLFDKSGQALRAA
ncbi:ABC transporter ATP-binding protein [Acidocella sp.]|uniref:ABC transporter ATP-binding protein n=1 Tax=Acidocella sp. TaxID=50710 RepID=UPI003CFE5941